jgi:DNA repair photolyase
VNAPAVLRRELARPSWSRETVALGTATDPYQAIEGRYRITRGIVEALCSAATPVGIVTRSPLIQRDIDLLRRLTAVARATVCVSVATIDEALARQIEPGVAPPRQRLRTIARPADAGIRCGVLLAPILPGLTDSPESLRGVIRAAREHGARFLNHTALHLGPVTRESFFRFLGRQHCDLIPRYERMYGGKYAPTAYRAELSRTVEAEKTQAGIVAARYLPPAREPVQLELPLGDRSPREPAGSPDRQRFRAGVRHRELGFGREHYVLTSPTDARSLPAREAPANR